MWCNYLYVEIKTFWGLLSNFSPPHLSLSLPDPSLVQILRYKDANAGWRSIPQLNGAGDDKVVISATAVFHIDTTSNSVFTEENSAKLPLGRQIVYRVMWRICFTVLRECEELSGTNILTNWKDKPFQNTVL